MSIRSVIFRPPSLTGHVALLAAAAVGGLVAGAWLSGDGSLAEVLGVGGAVAAGLVLAGWSQGCPPASSASKSPGRRPSRRSGESALASAVLRGRKGRYRMFHRIGSGATSVVHLAEDCATGEPVVVKLMREEVARVPSLRRRFKLEQTAARRSRCPFSIEVLDSGRAGDHRVPFLVTRHIDGHDLAEELSVRPRLPLADVLRLVQQLAVALDASHQAGVLHRDIKPANVLVSFSATTGIHYTLIDFGLCKLMDGDSMTDGAIGTPRYMAPEQARGGLVDARADVYGLACLTYRALVGQEAFFERGVEECLAAVQFRQPVQPSRIAPVPPAVEQVLAVGLAKVRSRRFRSCGELARALADAVGGSLPAVYAARARYLIEAHPWGHWDDDDLELPVAVMAGEEPLDGRCDDVHDRLSWETAPAIGHAAQSSAVSGA